MTESVFVPDIGDYKDVRIVEVLVKPGDQVAENDPLIARSRPTRPRWRCPRR